MFQIDFIWFAGRENCQEQGFAHYAYMYNYAHGRRLIRAMEVPRCFNRSSSTSAAVAQGINRRPRPKRWPDSHPYTSHKIEAAIHRMGTPRLSVPAVVGRGCPVIWDWSPGAVENVQRI